MRAARTYPPSISRACCSKAGRALHAAAWDEGVVDYVQLYVAPDALGPAGVRLFDGHDVSLSSLIEPKIEVARARYTHRRLCSPASLKLSAQSSELHSRRRRIPHAHPDAARRRAVRRATAWPSTASA